MAFFIRIRHCLVADHYATYIYIYAVIYIYHHWIKYPISIETN